MAERLTVCPHCEAATKAHPNNLHLEAGVTLDSEPFVHMAWGPQRQQMSPDEARDTGNQLALIASVAEYEAGFVKWCITKMGVTIEQASVMLMEIREFFATSEEETAGRVVKFPHEQR